MSIPNMKKDSSEIKRLQFELPEARLRSIDDMVVKCGLRTRKDLFDYAMTLLSWAIEEKSLGNDIASYNKGENHMEILRLPIFDHIKMIAESVEDCSEEESPSRGEVLELR